ncbi:pentatricopeptide repeat-containing protein At4g13650-like [Asparagus officinalis]|nr:pentatricopeptide repeat-containing protein At4g13650-like [Asparagus officinalis]
MAHSFVLRSASESSLFLSNNLLSSYFSCGSICYALRLFDRMSQRDFVSWNTMISGFNRFERYENGFCYFIKMIQAGIRPTQSSFASVIVACGEMGIDGYLMQVHCFSLKCGFSADCCVGNSLLKGYCKVGELEDLWKASAEMCALDDISLEILLRGCARHGMLIDALNLMRWCITHSIKLCSFAISSLISLCSRHCCIDIGIQIHGVSIKFGLDTNVSVINSFISFYARIFRLEDAENLFHWLEVEDRDIVTWNSLIGGFAYNGEGDVGLKVIQRMLSSGIRMNESTSLNFLSCCAVVNVLENAKRAHTLILKMRECFHQYTDNIILIMYCRSNSLNDAVAVFETMEVKDIVSFNLIMGLYRNYGNYEASIEVYLQARSQSIGEDEVMLSGVICSCSKLGVLELGLQIHGLVVKNGIFRASLVKNSILEFYSRAARIDDMEMIFFDESSETDIFSWNMMLMGYTNHGLFDKSISVWKEMKRWNIELNEFSYSALLDTCACTNEIIFGEQIHGYVRKKGLLSDTILMNSLLTMYSECGVIERAHSVFSETTFPDSVSWNALVSGYSQNGYAEESIQFYTMMNKNEIEASHMTFATIFMSCAMLSDLKLGSQFHAQVIKVGFESDLPISNSLITMYAKCGEISNSSEIFNAVIYKDVVTWNSMINALSHHGLGRKAIDLFAKMKSLGVKPNSVTFISVLSACRHAGLVSEACYQFRSMYEDCGIAPNEEHYTCMVDIFCRGGKLEEAKDLIESMEIVPSSLVWKMLLSACRVNGDVVLGKLAAERIMTMEPHDSSSYVLLSDLYASVGDREGKAKVRRKMEDRGVKKEAGCSWIL